MRSSEVPAFAYALRAIFANAPNSVLPERVFSILNDTFDDVQDPCYTQFRCTPYDEGLVGRQSLYLYLQYSSGSHTLLY
jgi:hypothetical protein